MKEKIRLELEDRVNFLIRNNIQWEINYRIPLKISSKHAKTWFARIHWKKKSEKPILIHDLRNATEFLSKEIPAYVEIQPILCYAKDMTIDNILLHELNHWYSRELYGTKIKPHGKEFKQTGIIIGIHKDFLGASFNAKYLNSDNPRNIPLDINWNDKPIKKSAPKSKTIYMAKCGNCEKIVYTSEKRTDIYTKLNNPQILTTCCNSMFKKAGRMNKSTTESIIG